MSLAIFSITNVQQEKKNLHLKVYYYLTALSNKAKKIYTLIARIIPSMASFKTCLLISSEAPWLTRLMETSP